MMTFAQAMAFITGFSHSGEPVTDLSRIRGLMHRLGDPQDSLKFIHIAGTNGKGSVAEYLTNIFLEAGYGVGTFTSPYIRRYTDRIRLNGQEIGERELCLVCEEIKSAVLPDEGFSQFEITFAAAMLYYARIRAEIVVLETGLGGLLDCTNCIKSPEACVLTTIAMDHMAVLGNTLPEITAQKAGIIKPDACVIVSPKNEPATIRTLLNRAAELGDHAWLPDKDEEHFEILGCTLTGTRFRFWGQTYETRMGGAHQIDNALTAIETAYALSEKGWNLPGLAVERGIARTQLPGRMQLVSKYPPILVDGGHNADGIAALCRTLRLSKHQPIIGIVGMTHGDAVEAAAKELSQVLDRVLCVDSFAPNAIPSAQLDAAFDQTFGAENSQSVSLGDALKIAKNWAHTNQGSIVICGSLFLVSWFLNEG